MRRAPSWLCAVLLAASIFAAPLAASAGNPTTLVLTDTFNRTAAQGEFILGAGNSTWAVRDGWLDYSTYWSIVSTGSVQTTANAYENPLVQDPLLTPTPNQRIIAVTGALSSTSSGLVYCAAVRVQPSGSYSYIACLRANGSANVYAVTGSGGATVIGSSLTGLTLVQGHELQIDFQAIGDGATTTTLTAVFSDYTGSATLGTITVTDTTAAMQSGGRVGLASATTNSAVTAYVQAKVYSDTAYTAVNNRICAIGDSITYGVHTTQGPASEIVARILNQRQASYHYIVENFGQGLATTGNWIPTASDNYLPNAVADCNSVGGASVYLITLGTNDAKTGGTTAATYLANTQAIVNYIAANAVPSGPKIIVNGPPYLDYVRANAAVGNYFGSGSVAAIQSYIAEFPSMAGVTIGDTSAINLFQGLDFTSLYDGIHPNDIGAPVLAELWANAIYPLGNSGPFGKPFFPSGN